MSWTPSRYINTSLRFLGLGALALALTTDFALAQDDAQSSPVDVGVAAQREEARAAYQSGDFVTARQQFVALAEAGQASSQVDLALMLLQGAGGPVDREAAEAWLERAAAQDHPVAFRILGQIERATTLPQADSETDRVRELWTRAAELGDTPAALLLGEYLLQTSPEADAAEAIDLVTRAAEAGEVRAQYLLAVILGQGRHVEADPKTAMAWLVKAAEAGDPQAQLELAQNFESGAIERKDSDASADAFHWYRRAAEGGHRLAQRWIGVAYLQGEGVERNVDEAIRWLEAAAAQNEPGSQFNLGLIYLDGEVIERDPARALKHLSAAAQNGIRQASFRAGQLLEDGDGVARDIDASFKFYRLADRQGSDRARRKLGQLAASNFLGGRVPPHETVPWVLHSAEAGDAESLAWLQKKADDGMREAMHALGLYLAGTEQGAEAPRDAEAAVDWFTRAAEQDLPRAQLELGRMISQGIGTETDMVAAHKWFNIAAARGLSEAAPLRDALTDLMTGEDVAEAQAEATAFFEQIRTAPIPVEREGR